MRRFALLFAVSLVLACGSPESRVEAPSSETPAASGGVSANRSATTEPASASNPCDALDARLERYDTSGKPFFFTFEAPATWTVNEFYGGPVAGFDITLNEDGNGGDDYVLRFTQTDKLLENSDNLVETWRKSPATVSVSEKEIEGRIMYLSRTRLGEMTGFQILFPALDAERGAYLVSAGITATPKGCHDKAVEVIDRIINGFEVNHDIGPAPEKP